MVLPDERIDYLKSLVDQSTGESFPIPFKGKRKSFPIFRCNTNMLIYRLKNGRTKMQQREYIDQKGLGWEFFADQESAAAQKAQHMVLLKMVDEQGLKKDLIENDQRDPLIITYDGVVLNGNRRLACLRETPNHTYVDIIILPLMSQEELYELEVELQMAQDFKSPYNWVNELLTIREGVVELGISKKNMAKKMRLERQTSNEVTKLLRILDTIDLFLDRQGKQEAYYLVGGDQQKQVFRTVAEKAASMKNPSLRAAYLDRAFTLIENPPIEDSLYNWVRKLANNFDTVIKREREATEEESELPIRELNPGLNQEQESAIPTRDNDNSDPFDRVPEELMSISIPLSGFSDPDEAKDNSSDLIRMIDAAVDEAKEVKNSELPLKFASDAYSKLEGICLTTDTTLLRELATQLDRIVLRTKKLQVEVATLMTKKTK